MSGIRHAPNCGLLKKVVRIVQKRRDVDCDNMRAALDKVFSRYIRMRDADDDGYVKCVTCGKREWWQDVDCGHFIQRDRLAVRYSTENAHAQCKRCNRYRGGEQFLHGEAIRRLHGADAPERLRIMASQTARVDAMWYIAQLDMFREACKRIERMNPALKTRR